MPRGTQRIPVRVDVVVVTGVAGVGRRLTRHRRRAARRQRSSSRECRCALSAIPGASRSPSCHDNAGRNGPRSRCGSAAGNAGGRHPGAGGRRRRAGSRPRAVPRRRRALVPARRPGVDCARRRRALRRWPPRLALADDAPAGDGRRRRPLGLPWTLGPAPAHGPLSGDHDVRHRGAGPGRMRDGARRPLAGDRHRRRWPPVPRQRPAPARVGAHRRGGQLPHRAPALRRATAGRDRVRRLRGRPGTPPPSSASSIRRALSPSCASASTRSSGAARDGGGAMRRSTSCSNLRFRWRRGRRTRCSRAATSLLPWWAKLGLRLPWLPVTETVAARPAGQVLVHLLRWALAPGSPTRAMELR